MLVQLLISMFGIVFVHRILSLLEKNEVMKSSDFKVYFIFLQFPLILNLFFKELSIVIIIYIGVIQIILIGFTKLITYFHKNSFEKLHLNIIQRILLQISTGKSYKMSLKNVWSEFSAREQATFAPLRLIIEESFADFHLKHNEQTFFYGELTEIMSSNSHTIEQIQSLRRILSIQYNLRHRSRQCLLQIRAQALVCALIYLLIFALSYTNLGLKLVSIVSLASFLMLVSGLYIILNADKSFKWEI